MKKSPHSDEDLLRMHRENNDSSALSELMDRYFAMRNYSCRTVAPAAASQLNDWELNEVVFHAIYTAVRLYDFREVKLMSYYHILLKHELIHAVNKKRSEAPFGVVSIDHYNEYQDRGGYVLADTIASANPNDDPRAFLNYAETLMEFQKLPEDVTPETVTVVELVTQGFSVAHAAKVIGVETHRARYLLRKFRTWALGTAKKIYGYSEQERKEKEKLLDDFLRWKKDEE